MQLSSFRHLRPRAARLPVIVVSVIAIASATPVAARPTVANTVISGGDAQSTASIRRYWSDQRMAAARDPGMAEHQTSGRGAGVSAQNMANQTPGAVYTQQWWATPRPVGELYFHDPATNSDAACTATVVARNVLLTAGHCVVTAVTTNGQHTHVGHTTFLFVPRMWGDSQPDGVWAGDAWTSWTAWADWRNFGLDYGLIHIAPRASDGAQIGDVTGWLGITTQVASYPSGIWNLGYPASGDFATWSGDYPFGCHAPYHDWDQITSGDGTSAYSIAMGCMSNAGASGGPWIIPVNGDWSYVSSVNSTCWASWTSPDGGVTPSCKAYHSENLWGPWFDARILTLFNAFTSQHPT